MFGLTNYRPNRMAAYNPFRDLEAFERAFFKDPFGDFFTNGGTLAEFKTDIVDQGDNFLLEADLPGFDKNDVHLELDGDTLTINAERHSENEEKDKQGNYIRCERSFGKYSRSFNVEAVDVDNIRAKMDNGVLTLTLPKKQEVLPEKKQLLIE